MLFKLGPIASGYGIVASPSGKDLLLSNNVVVNPYTTMYCRGELLGLWCVHIDSTWSSPSVQLCLPFSSTAFGKG